MVWKVSSFNLPASVLMLPAYWVKPWVYSYLWPISNKTLQPMRLHKRSPVPAILFSRLDGEAVCLRDSAVGKLHTCGCEGLAKAGLESPFLYPPGKKTSATNQPLHPATQRNLYTSRRFKIPVCFLRLPGGPERTLWLRRYQLPNRIPSGWEILCLKFVTFYHVDEGILCEFLRNLSSTTIYVVYSYYCRTKSQFWFLRLKRS